MSIEVFKREKSYSFLVGLIRCFKMPDSHFFRLARLGKLYYDYMLRKWSI